MSTEGARPVTRYVMIARTGRMTVVGDVGALGRGDGDGVADEPPEQAPAAVVRIAAAATAARRGALRNRCARRTLPIAPARALPTARRTLLITHSPGSRYP